MNSDFEQRIWNLLADIPVGRVTTYGQLAAMAGFPGYARQVGRVLKNLPAGSILPWHRVINASGQISFPQQSEAYWRQRTRLLDEGIIVQGNRINLNSYRWAP